MHLRWLNAYIHRIRCFSNSLLHLIRNWLIYKQLRWLYSVCCVKRICFVIIIRSNDSTGFECWSLRELCNIFCKSFIEPLHYFQYIMMLKFILMYYIFGTLLVYYGKIIVKISPFFFKAYRIIKISSISTSEKQFLRVLRKWSLFLTKKNENHLLCPTRTTTICNFMIQAFNFHSHHYIFNQLSIPLNYCFLVSIMSYKQTIPLDQTHFPFENE